MFFYRDSSTNPYIENIISENYINANIGNNKFKLKLASTPTERMKGLMNITFLNQYEGMLFVFEKPEIQYFWMKNTLIPLDIIFLDENFRVIKIHKNTIPQNTDILYSSEKPSLYAIELNANVTDQINLTLGDVIEFID
jgi:uncharacterized membrane protein (UPF0127 family)